MLGKKFQNRMSLIRRDTERRESIREARKSLAAKPVADGSGMGAIEEDESDDQMEKILENAEDFESTALNHNYDMINLRLRPDDEEPENPFRRPCIEQLTKYFNKIGDKESNPQMVIDSKSLFAVDIQIYLKEDKGSEAILVLAEGTVLLLFKFNKAPVVTPFPITAFTNLMLAENVPSACTLEVNAETEKKINRSHLVLESPSMGLLMRYMLEREYNIEIDFTDAVPIRIGGKDIDFCFEDLNVYRAIAAQEENSGIIRSTFDGQIYELEGVGMFSKGTWKSCFSVMTNVGFYIFNEKDLLEAPELLGIKTLKLETMRGQKRAGRDNLFELTITIDKGKELTKTFSVEDPQTYTKWEKKIKEML